MNHNQTIAAKATGSGGAITIIRLSGSSAISICESMFEPTAKGRVSKSQKLSDHRGFTLHYGLIKSEGRVVDDVLVSLFRAPNSYTGEDMVEISCHASPYIEQEILRLCAEAGAHTAHRGEFTMRAFLNGKIELSQAEAVADIIAADSRASHDLASKQMRGGYSHEFTALRNKLIELLSLLELELDFGEEDVEFAERERLLEIVDSISLKIDKLSSSFKLGNILKNGVPVAIVGSPNVGKSTLLNALLNEDKAMVSDIAGTTRDTVEDTINIGGVCFRFIDTAGIRDTSDQLENMGIERTFRKIETASVVLIVVDAQTAVTSGCGVVSCDSASRLDTPDISMEVLTSSPFVSPQPSSCSASSFSDSLGEQFKALSATPLQRKSSESVSESSDLSREDISKVDWIVEINKIFSVASADKSVKYGLVINKIDKVSSVAALGLSDFLRSRFGLPVFSISAKEQSNIDQLHDFLLDSVGISIEGAFCNDDTIVFNSRHHEALIDAHLSLLRAREALVIGIPGDLLSQDLREVLYHLGLITGDITTDDILESIFSKFCIGK